MQNAVNQAVFALRGRDGVFVALLGCLVVAGLALAVYGIAANFIPATSFHRQNESVAYGVGAIYALSGLYLLLEAVPGSSV